jgi:hypothetical protein
MIAIATLVLVSIIAALGTMSEMTGILDEHERKVKDSRVREV